MSTSSISGYILAGGRSSRLGQDKRRLKIGEFTLLEQTCNVVQEALGSKPVFVGDNISVEIAGDHRIIPDTCSYVGPVAGLISALQDCRTPWALILAADLPFLSVESLRSLIQSAHCKCYVVTFAHAGKIEPLLALYRRETLSFWQNRLAAGKLALYEGLLELTVEKLDVSDTCLDFFNLNTPADLVEFQRILQK